MYCAISVTVGLLLLTTIAVREAERVTWHGLTSPKLLRIVVLGNIDMFAACLLGNDLVNLGLLLGRGIGPVDNDSIAKKRVNLLKREPGSLRIALV